MIGRRTPVVAFKNQRNSELGKYRSAVQSIRRELGTVASPRGRSVTWLWCL